MSLNWGVVKEEDWIIFWGKQGPTWVWIRLMKWSEN